MPKVEAAAKPTVNLTAKSSSGRSAYSSNNGQSALDLLSQSRVGEVMSVVCNDANLGAGGSFPF